MFFCGGDSVNEEKSMVNDLTTGSVTRQLLKFSWPLILANLLQTIYNMVDMVVVGRYVGSAGLSAISTGTEMLHLATFLCMGFANAGQIIIAQLVGSGNRKRISATIGTMFTFILGISIILTFVMLWICPTVLHLMNTPESAYDHALGYSRVCYIGLFFIFGYNVVSAILRGMGDSKRPLIFIGVAAMMNLVLDLLFVAKFGLGAKGAALATVIGQAFSFIASIIYLVIKRESFGFDFKLASFKIDGEMLWKLVKLGLPLALQMSAVTISSMFVTSFVNSYGVVASAVTGVGNKIATIMTVLSMAFSTAGSAMIGQNFGAGKLDRVKKILWVTESIGCAFAAILAVIMIATPKGVFSLFTSDEEVLEMAVTYAPIAVLNFFGFATRAPFMALVNGLGNGKLALFIGIVDGIVARIGLSILLGVAFNMGIMGFWIGSVLAGYVPVLIGGGYYFSGLWKKKELNIA
jgi:putative MATE family efflux protein